MAASKTQPLDLCQAALVIRPWTLVPAQQLGKARRAAFTPESSVSPGDEPCSSEHVHVVALERGRGRKVLAQREWGRHPLLESWRGRGDAGSFLTVALGMSSASEPVNGPRSQRTWPGAGQGA